MNEFNPYQPTSEMSADPYAFQSDGPALATRGERFAGAFIDGILQLILILPLSLGIGIALGAMMGDSPALNFTAQFAGGLMGVAVFMALNGYLLATQGRTIGKMVMKTRIVDRNTNQIQPFWPLIGKRYAWLWICSMLPFLGIVALIDALMIFRASRACLHDDVAGTKVIKG